MHFSIDQHRLGDLAVITLRGGLTSETADLFSACIDTTLPSARSVVVDLTGATDLDGEGLSVLLSAERSARRKGGTLRTAGVHGVLERVFEESDVWDDLGGNRTVDEEVRRAVAHAAAQDYFRPPVTTTALEGESRGRA